MMRSPRDGSPLGAGGSWADVGARAGRLLRTILFGRKHDWGIGIASGAVALVALITGSAFGRISPGASLSEVLVALGTGVGILVFGVVATTRISEAVSRLAFLRSTPSAGVAARILTSGVGYLICVFALLAVLDVGIGKVLVGAGLAGVVLGIAAQPSLGNVFAGIVLVAARPFLIGDHIRVRSGALGGIFDAWVVDLSLAYVTLRTDDGILRVPNASMLAAGVLQLTPDSSPLVPAGASTAPAGAPSPPAGQPTALTLPPAPPPPPDPVPSSSDPVPPLPDPPWPADPVPPDPSPGQP